MINNNQKIRQLLKDHCKECLSRPAPAPIVINSCSAEKCKITASLAFLPCKTCNDTGKRPGCPPYLDPIPCPDCNKEKT